MGSIINSLFGGGSSGSGSSSNSASEISNLLTNAQYQQTLANQTDQEGKQIYDSAFGQYQQGLTGQLSPSQQALVTQNLGVMDTGTSGTYGSMGLGGSTMESQDLASNALKSMAEQSNINFQNEAEGLSGLGVANNYFGTTNTALSGATSSLSDAGKLANTNNEQLNNAISSLGNKVSGSGSGSGSSSGGLLSGLGSLFSTSGSGGVSGVVDSGAFLV